MNSFTIIIIDDHTLIRETWSFVINRNPGFRVVATSGSAEEGIALCRQHRPHIVTLDINLPGMSGMEAVPHIRKYAPASRILGVSLHTQPAYVKKMMQNGASGYITKNSSSAEMMMALQEVAEGRKYIGREIKNILAENLLDEEEAEKSIHALSLREIEMIELIRQGYSSKEIAARTSISVKTVEVHRYNILKKLNLKNAAALVNYVNHYEL
jgi:DNA-binding NarL/FixJ family response regulator